MSTHFTRGLAAAVGALAVAGAALVAAPAASANGTLSITPSSGDGTTALSVTTTGGCASPNATHYVVKLTGGSLTEDINLNGLQPLSSIPASGAQTTPMAVPVGYTLEMAQEAYGSAIPTGVYDLEFICRAATVAQPITVFETKVTIKQIAGGLTFAEGAEELPIEVVTAPKVTGKAKAGATLKVSKGTWSPSDVTVKATWKIGTKTVGKALSYKVKPGDKGKTIKVTVTASKSGYKSATWTKSIKVAK
jgi:hypothetical protein